MIHYKRIIHLVRTQNFPKNQHILPAIDIYIGINFKQQNDFYVEFLELKISYRKILAFL